jgi:hypothetical protein
VGAGDPGPGLARRRLGTLILTALASLYVLNRRRRALDHELPADDAVAGLAAQRLIA